MIYTTDKFKRVYQELSQNDKQNINNIVTQLNSLSSKEYPEYLSSLCGNNGNAKWSGINKTLYHLYPQGQSSVHRLFYCYATDLDEHLREKGQIIDGVIFIDYTIRHDDEIKTARNYEKNNINYLNRFEPIEHKNNEKDELVMPSFWFCLTKEQEEVLKLPQPSLIKGSAGTGKTVISFELLKQWITDDENKRYLYLTYTDNLLNKAKKSLYEDGVSIDNNRIVLSNFSELIELENEKIIINEIQSREIIKDIIQGMIRVNNLPDDILFTDYFLYSYIRGMIKGQFNIDYIESIDLLNARVILNEFLIDKDFTINEKNRILRQILDVLENNELNEKRFRQETLGNIVSIYDSKKDRDLFATKVRNLFSKEVFVKLTKLKVRSPKYSFPDDSQITNQLSKELIPINYIQNIIEIKNKYNKILDDNKYIDDNDLALFILNNKKLEENKYDGIIVDEVQDLTEIQIEAIVKLSKSNSNDISFFGDPNQTINPTVYDYGRFNSYVYKEKKQINRQNLKITHRCGPNLLDYINHLTQLRKTLKLTTIREDVEPEESANTNKIDTYWSCLVEEQDTIDHVLETFTNAIDCYLIVDNDETKKLVVNRIQKIIDEDIDDTILDQIITVQNAKGLESKNVIIYNLISDNLDIFKNLNSQNNKISTMTFNKFYVATTRAEDSIIICEEKLNQANEVKSQLFYSNNRLMVENISADDIQDYLLSSNDPERFLDQAEILIENQEYDKALKKSLIAIKNIVNQFRDYELFGNIINLIEQNKKLSDIFISYNPRDINEIGKFKKLYDNVIDYCETIQKIDEIDLIYKRREILDKSIRIRDISTKVQDFEILKNDLRDMDIVNEFIEKFIILKEYNYAIKVSQNIENSSIRFSIYKIIRYCFGYISYLEAADDFSKIEFLNYDFYKWLLDNKIIEDTKIVLKNITNNLKELTNG